MQRQLERLRLVFRIEQVRQRRAGYPGVVEPPNPAALRSVRREPQWRDCCALGARSISLLNPADDE
jgi:hypothetical protein